MNGWSAINGGIGRINILVAATTAEEHERIYLIIHPKLKSVNPMTPDGTSTCDDMGETKCKFEIICGERMKSDPYPAR